MGSLWGAPSLSETGCEEDLRLLVVDDLVWSFSGRRVARRCDGIARYAPVAFSCCRWKCVRRLSRYPTEI